jgi:hypothetical protein
MHDGRCATPDAAHGPTFNAGTRLGAPACVPIYARSSTHENIPMRRLDAGSCSLSSMRCPAALGDHSYGHDVLGQLVALKIASTNPG